MCDICSARQARPPPSCSFTTAAAAASTTSSRLHVLYALPSLASQTNVRIVPATNLTRLVFFLPPNLVISHSPCSSHPLIPIPSAQAKIPNCPLSNDRRFQRPHSASPSSPSNNLNTDPAHREAFPINYTSDFLSAVIEFHPRHPHPPSLIAGWSTFTSSVLRITSLGCKA